MFKINDYVVYKRNVCKIKEVKEDKDTNKKYYVLLPMEDESLTINVPVANNFEFIRNIITKKEVERIITSIPSIEVITSINDKAMEQNYKYYFSDGGHESLIKIIKTTFLRNKERLDNNKRAGEKDTTYFKKAEKLLYNEFSIALNMTYDETKKYVSDKVAEL
jgi:CarD family transcriptional regulator